MGSVRVFAEDAFPCVVWGTNARASSPVKAARGALSSRRVPHDRARWTAEPWHIDAPADRALIDELHRRWPAFGDVVGRPARGIVTGANDVFEIDRATRARLLANEPEVTDDPRKLGPALEGCLTRLFELQGRR